MTRTDDFPAAMDRWSPEDWQEYRDRVDDGEGSAQAIDAINRRLTRKTKEEGDRCDT